MELGRVVLKRFLHFFVRSANGSLAGTSVLGSNNKSNLSTGVSGDGSVSVFYRLVFLADGVHERADEFAVKPHALSLGADNTSFSESIVHSVVKGSLEEDGGRSDGVRAVSNNNVEGVLVLSHELGSIHNVNSHTRIIIAFSKSR
jgi:hypothetical protein